MFQCIYVNSQHTVYAHSAVCRQFACILMHPVYSLWTVYWMHITLLSVGSLHAFLCIQYTVQRLYAVCSHKCIETCILMSMFPSLNISSVHANFPKCMFEIFDICDYPKMSLHYLLHNTLIYSLTISFLCFLLLYYITVKYYLLYIVFAVI